MTDAVCDWLPSDALAGPALVDRVDAAIAAWSTRWFADRGPKRVGRTQPGAPPAGSWTHLGPGVWIESGASLSLGWRALGYGGVQPKAAPGDERLLAAYAARIGQDLAAALGEALGFQTPADTAAPAAGMLVRLGGNPGRSLQLLIAESALVAPRKALCPPWKRGRGEATPLSEALGSVPIAFEASLGTARTSALDLRDIAAGDIVVLQRAASDPVLLRACDTGAVIGGANLVFGEDGYMLKAS